MTDDRRVIEVGVDFQNKKNALIAFMDSTNPNTAELGVTGKGDAFRIFATVGAIVKDFLNRYKTRYKKYPETLSFDGKSDEPSRIKLYDTIAKSIGKFLPGYTFSGAQSSGDTKMYTFKRIQ